MKPTPEKKALIEYGKARGRLEGRRDEFIIADIVFGISKQEAIASFRKHHPIRSALVKDAWKKRAVLRITCSECQTYNVELKDSFKNIWCPYAEIYTNGKSRCVGCPFFEPRKEGE